MRNPKYIIFMLTFFISFSLFGINVSATVTKEDFQKKLQEINDFCNNVSFDVEASKTEILGKLKNETDPFERGKLSSAMVTINTIQGNYDGLVTYSKEAVKNYKKVAGGEYYAIGESKYLAWAMVSLQRYSDSFEAANEILGLLKTIDPNLLDDELKEDTEVLVNVIFLTIYSNLDIKEAAEAYYNKLNNMPISDEVMLSRGNIIAFSNFTYAYSIKDYELMKKYAQECYDISVKVDELRGLDSAEGLLLNIALSNVKLGNYDEALEQLQRSESFYKSKGDVNNLSSIKVVYANYNDGIGNINIAYEYYIAAINSYSEIGDLRGVKSTLEEFFEFCERRNITEGLDYFYKLYYTNNLALEKSGTLSDFIDSNIKITEDLTNFKIEALESETQLAKRRNTNFIFTIIILCSLLLWTYILFNQRKANQKNLEKIANEDYLTGTNTRSYGSALLKKTMNANIPLSLAVLDIDNFKKINDTYGHLLGDEVLKSFVNLIKENISNDDILIRFGGEEFVVAFVNKDINSAKETLEKIRKNLKEINIENISTISFSAGVAKWNKESIKGLLAICDKLLYKAKNNGKNRIEI